jgi:hypothetical protein
MSSSRSIAAARQKRAGEQSSNNTNNSSTRPVTSISSQSVFAQQQQQQQSRSQSQGSSKYNQINTSAGRQRSSQSQIQNQQQQQVSSVPQQKQITKISVPDAIGLITLRLGKLEKFIQEAMEDGTLSFMTNNSNNEYDSNSMKLVSDEVFENIANRLESLEKKNANNANNNTPEQITKINKDIKDIKDSINTLNIKVTSFINETQDKFLDYENALIEIEKNFELCEEDTEYKSKHDEDCEDNMENIDDDTVNIVTETLEESITTNSFFIDNDMQLDDEEQ